METVKFKLNIFIPCLWLQSNAVPLWVVAESLAEKDREIFILKLHCLVW